MQPFARLITEKWLQTILAAPEPATGPRTAVTTGTRSRSSRIGMVRMAATMYAYPFAVCAETLPPAPFMSSTNGTARWNVRSST